MKRFIFLILYLTSVEARSQEPVVQIDSVVKQFFIVQGDTIARESIDLDEVVILGKISFKSSQDRHKYLILKRKTEKVYPYAKLAAERLVELNERLNRINSKPDQRRYTRIVQKYIENEFSAELKKLTRTEGQILVKLMHRQTGITTFDLIKNLKSGWRAFWYNTTASLFDISLKEEYHPESNKEDYWIEDILERAFQADILERQASVLDFDFMELTNKWDKTPLKKE